MPSQNDNLTTWFSGRPQWLRIAATRLLQQTELTDKDISEIAALCQQEAEGKLPKTTFSFPASAFSQCAAGNLRLCSISDVEGVNALAPKKPLEFGKGNITVVYGNTGSGKSGYVRLLKHVCGARNLGTLYRNVYKPGSTTQKACISFELDGTPKKHPWSGQGICEDLSNVNIFDTSFGKVFVSKDGDEVSYEPPVLSFFSSLIEVCEKVAAALEAEANRHQSKKPNIPADKKFTPEGSWYESVGVKTTPQDIEKHCAFSSTDEAEMLTLQKRLAEQAPAEKAKQLRKQKQHIDTLVQDAQKYLEQLSDENCRRIIVARRKSILKKTTADTAAEKVFSGSELEGIGSDVWKELWEAARNYSILAAYKETAYPNVSKNSRCVLCLQTLSQEAKERLISFENFVKGEMQKAATDAAKEYETANQTIEALPTLETLKTRIDAADIPEVVANQVTEFFTQLQNRKDQLPRIDSEEAILAAPSSPKWIEEANTLSQSLGELAVKYDEDDQSDNREETKKRLNNLQAKKWLSEHRPAIDEEVNRLKLLSQIHEAKKSTNTKTLSEKKGELGKALVTDTFVQRFNAELKELGASQLKVELVKTGTPKGKVLHKIQLRDAAQRGLADVLSEGEHRIVSIASFLADATCKTNLAPLIFDDPISSLDQNYEEAVVQRLIGLSQDRQVIVFTHRLSLLGTVMHLTKKISKKADVVSIRSADWGTGEPAPIPLSQSDITTALNTLMNQRYQDTKKASENGDFEQAEILLKSMCSDFRTLVERSIENDLLCGVVQRFQRPVDTLKLKNLAKLKAEDCNLLDSLMTKYSGFEHSQPAESPVELPKPDALLADMTKLKIWRKDYSDRTAAQ